jgi:hypothetical protein
MRIARWGSLLLLMACVTKTQPPVKPEPKPAPPPAVSPWFGVLASARRAADAGHFDDAERILATFAVEHPGTPEGAEADFWRALFRADPANTKTTLREQLSALDAYINGGPSQPRYTEAVILRRMVETVDSARAVIVAVRATADARDRAKNDEVKRLTEELEKAVAEMERIRRRLAPKPDEKKPPYRDSGTQGR